MDFQHDRIMNMLNDFRQGSVSSHSKKKSILNYQESGKRKVLE